MESRPGNQVDSALSQCSLTDSHRVTSHTTYAFGINKFVYLKQICWEGRMTRHEIYDLCCKMVAT